MAGMALDYSELAIVIGGLVVMSAFAFYALKILANFRSGMLERGWKDVALGAVFLISAQLLLLISQIGAAGLTNSLDLAASLLRFLAMIFLILGLREHYLVWRVDKARPVPVEN